MTRRVTLVILCGMTPQGPSVAPAMPRKQATPCLARSTELRKPLFDYMERILEQSRERGYVETLFGRRRPMPDIKSSNFAVRTAAERAAINMPIQGTEADLMKLAMIKLDKRLREEHGDSRLLLQIHDSILVECPSAAAKDVSDLLKDAMENAYKLPGRLDVEVTPVNNGGEL